MSEIKVAMGQPVHREKVESRIHVKRKSSKIKKFMPLFILMFPGLLYLLINNYLPMFGIVIAFKDVNFAQGIWASPWIGFKNFEFLFKTTDAWIITRNTLLYNAAFIVINTTAAIATAIFLNEIKNRFFSRFYQSAILLPHLISMVLVSYLTFSLFSGDAGFLNKTVLPMLGLKGIQWYSEAQYWPIILPLVNMWKNVGFLTIIYLAAIVGIDPEYYEAARLDGASKWQQIRYITIPFITPVIVIMTILAVGRIFSSDFGLFYQVPMDSGPLYNTTQTIDTYVYRGLMKLGDIGMASAAGLYQSFVGFLLVLLSNFIVRKVSKDNALF